MIQQTCSLLLFLDNAIIQKFDLWNVEIYLKTIFLNSSDVFCYYLLKGSYRLSNGKWIRLEGRIQSIIRFIRSPSQNFRLFIYYFFFLVVVYTIFYRFYPNKHVFFMSFSAKVTKHTFTHDYLKINRTDLKVNRGVISAT